MLIPPRHSSTRLPILLVTFTVFLTGCSAKELYQVAQKNREQHCQQQSPDTREACEKNLNKLSYEQYQKAKQSLKNKK